MSARYRPGASVRVRRAFPPGHLRTPYYARGKTGVVERVCGAFPNPETLAYGKNGAPAQPLYRVRFAQKELWPDYRGAAQDTVDIELYEHWLEPA